MSSPSKPSGDRADGQNHDRMNDKLPPLIRPAWRALIQDMSPMWFTWCMNSGILGLLTHQCPYQFSGLHIISTIFYILDLVLFVFFSTTFILRFVVYRRDAYNELTNNHAELYMTACWSIAFMTLTALTGFIASNATWGYHGFSMVAYVMWWIETAWVLLFEFWIFTTVIRGYEKAPKRVPPLVILPAVSLSTVAVTGGLIVSYSHDISPHLAVPVIITAFTLVGSGFLLGLIICTFLFYGFLTQGWPPPAQTTTVFMLIGPMGQSAAALQALGAAASKFGKFAAYNQGTFITAEAATSLHVACVLLGLIMSGLGVTWLVFAILLMIERAIKGELKWQPNWNSIIFPTATLVTSLNLFAVDMDSPAFRVITTILIICLVIVFLGNLAFTIMGIVKGELLIVREDPRVRKMMEEKEKEK